MEDKIKEMRKEVDYLDKRISMVKEQIKAIRSDPSNQ